MQKRSRFRVVSYFQELWSLLIDTYTEWRQDNATTLGAALAFYTIFSLAPIVIIVVAIVGFFLGQDYVQVFILDKLTEFLGKDNAVNIMNIVQSRYKPGFGIRATIVAVVIILVGSTTVFVMLKNALNTMWGVESGSTGFLYILKERIMSFVVVVFIGMLIFLSMMLSSLVSALNLFLGNYVEIPLILIAVTDNIFTIILLTFLFAVLYKILPDVQISWGDVWIGGAITAILFTLGKYLFGLYLTKSSISSAYGAAGSLVVILMWVYYSALIIFFGAEFTQVFAKKYGSEIVPKEPRR